MTAYIPSMYEIETFSGRYIDVAYPQYESVCLEDIAHHLAHTCRYGGACDRFYSVAEHAVIVSRRLEELGVPKWMVLAGLHHDDAEAYLGDIPRPLKLLLQPAYERLTEQMDEAICKALFWAGSEALVPGDFHLKEVKDADNYALLLEARHLLPSEGVNWSGSALSWDLDMSLADAAALDPPYWTAGLDPIDAEGIFLSRHHELI